MGMLVAVAIAPGSLLVSASIGVIVAAVVRGRRRGARRCRRRWRCSARASTAGQLRAPAARATRGFASPSARCAGPARRLALVLLPLACSPRPRWRSTPAPPDVQNLPSDDAARKDYEAFDRDRGAGWSTPYEVVFRTNGPVDDDSASEGDRRASRTASRSSTASRRCSAPRCCASARACCARSRATSISGRRDVRRLERGLKPNARRHRPAARRAQAGRRRRRAARGGSRAGRGRIRARSRRRRATPRRRRSGWPTASGRRATGRGSITGGLEQARDGTKQLETNLEDPARLARRRRQHVRREARRRRSRRTQSAIQSALRNIGGITDPAVANDPAVQRVKQDLQRALAALGPLRTNVTNLTTELDANATASRGAGARRRRLLIALTQLADGQQQARRRALRRRATALRPAGRRGRASSARHDALDSGLDALLTGPDGRSGARALATGSDEAYKGTQPARARGQDDAGQRRARALDQRQAPDARCAATAPTSSRPRARATSCSPRSKARSRRSARTPASRPTRRAGGNTARVIVVPRKGPFGPQGAPCSGQPLERETEADGEQGRGDRASSAARPWCSTTSTRRPRRSFILLALVLSTGHVPRAAGGLPRAVRSRCWRCC